MVGKNVFFIFISCLQSFNDEGGFIFRNFCLVIINIDILVNKDEWRKFIYVKFYYQKIYFDLKFLIYNEICYR